MRSEVTRSRIIEAALECFLEKGFDDASLQMVAKKAHITQPAIYTHFNNKVGLLIGCAQYAAENLRDYVDSHMSPKDSAAKRARAFFRANFEWFSRNRALSSSLMALYYFASTHPEVLGLYQVIQTAGIERIEGLLYQGQHEGVWKLRDPLKTSRMLHSLLVGELIKALHSYPKESVAKQEARFWEQVSSLLGA